jgi:hypothetical protein
MQYPGFFDGFEAIYRLAADGQVGIGSEYRADAFSNEMMIVDDQNPHLLSPLEAADLRSDST